jgi:hypothetical protein
MADAWVAVGHADSARVVLEAEKAKARTPSGAQFIQQAIDRLPH